MEIFSGTSSEVCAAVLGSCEAFARGSFRGDGDDWLWL